MHSLNETFVHSFHLIHHRRESQLDTLFDVAGYCLLAYDYFLNLNDEITFIWPTPLNIGKVLFLLVRYIPFIDGALLLYAHMNTHVAADNLCNVLYCIYGPLIFLVMITTEGIILFRTCALIRRTRRGYYLIYTLCFLSICVVVICFHFMYESLIPSKLLDEVPSEASRSLLHNRCDLKRHPGLAGIFVNYIILVCYETILFLLMLYYCLGIKKYNNSSRLITTLLRDGVIYYLYLSGISIINVCVIKILHAPDRLILFQQNLHSNFATRILINLRRAVQRETELSLQCTNITSSRESTGYLTSVIIGAETWFQSHDDTLDPDEPVSTN